MKIHKKRIISSILLLFILISIFSPYVLAADIGFVLTVDYSPNKPTYDNVKVTISSNKTLTKITGWILSEDKKSMYKIYNDNMEENITVESTTGESSNVTIQINYIDRKSPQLENSITKNANNTKAFVTVKANEPLQEVDGWTLSEDKMTLTKTYVKNMEEIVEIKDLAGNITSLHVTINYLEESISSSYERTSDDCLIKIKPGTTYAQFKQNIEEKIEYTVLDGTRELTDSDIIKTGQIMRRTNGEDYTIAVTGDLNGDGYLRLSDLAILKMALVGKKELSVVYLRAADLNYDNRVKLSDLSKIKMVLVGKENV